MNWIKRWGNTYFGDLTWNETLLLTHILARSKFLSVRNHIWHHQEGEKLLPSLLSGSIGLRRASEATEAKNEVGRSISERRETNFWPHPPGRKKSHQLGNIFPAKAINLATFLTFQDFGRHGSGDTEMGERPEEESRVRKKGQRKISSCVFLHVFLSDRVFLSRIKKEY